MKSFFETLEKCKPGDGFRGKPKNNYVQYMRKILKLGYINLNNCLDLENFKNMVSEKSQRKAFYTKIVAEYKKLNYPYL